MKTLKESISENTINESFDAFTCIHLILLYVCIGLVNDIHGNGWMFNPTLMFKDIKKWRNDAKINKISKRLASDPEIQEFMLNGGNGDLKKIIAGKLSPEESKYLSNITKLNIDKHIDYDKLTGWEEK